MALHRKHSRSRLESEHAGEVRETAQILVVLMAIGAGLVSAVALTGYLILCD